jgi:hypothetical protein
MKFKMKSKTGNFFDLELVCEQALIDKPVVLLYPSAMLGKPGAKG